ncbi:hypothetical protein F2P56_030482 [Juglans regia]|uniref:Uncharacterized protein n=1 Tax=Juglans regia TaxID=51240 RepID=A0A833SZT9_JUGRE|nr:hypothetical protein F2P56_030482 [Juglans regia]
MQEWVQLNHILSVYEAASGQKLNKDETSLFFSRNTRAATRTYIMEVAGLQASTNLDRYLGLPSIVGKSKTRAFNGIVDRVIMRLDNWKNKFLSKAGKEILIKAVLQSLLTYTMTATKSPLKEITFNLCKILVGS